ncbi:hypothetical protein J3R82DRAFT_7342 [Butyriboletus roseoflavus]|nr:hypothetical protein J3R82DRAFT_7342 [Butyriboletus roseoflavus]
MGSTWGVWDDMPPLADANTSSQAPRNSIPPPPGATTMPAPRTAPSSTMQYPWGTPFPAPNYSFPSPQDRFGAWHWNHDTTAFPQQSGPSPYLPRQPLHPEMPSHDPFAQLRGMHNLSNPPQGSRKRSNSLHKYSPWPLQGDLSPLDIPTRMPDVHQFVPRAPDMHTPSSTLSRSISLSARIPPGTYHERPQHWRHDFKFKSGFASMLRSWSNPVRTLDDFVDSTKLDLHPFLRYNKSRPITIYDLRREPLTVKFRALDRAPLASDMDHSVTHPPTQFMRLYHSRLPWYIDIHANGAPYISLADFFQQLFASLSKQISKYDFYNNELDDDDREVLTRAYFERCLHEDDKMEGVKRVDFVRGKQEWMGLTSGKDGMRRLRTG